jgi:hypothetical protein
MEQEQTTPETEVTQGSSFDDKILSKFGLSEETPVQEQPPEAEAQAQTEEVPQGEELSPEEIQADEVSDDLELTHNGQKVRVRKDEAVKLAQQGYDYTQKTQALAKEREMVEQAKAAIKARVELTPKLIQAAAKVEALQQQLQPYANVDWVALATQDPSGYPTHHANYTRLQQQLQQASQEASKVWNDTQSVDKTINEIDLQKAQERLMEKLPQWRDAEKRRAEQEKLVSYLKSEEFTDSELATFHDPRVVVMARKAMLYDAALQNRQQKQNQIKSAPAVKPGVSTPQVSIQAKKADAMKQLHNAKDPARKKALFDEVLALKFGLN